MKKNKDGKIVEISEAELFSIYLQHNWDDIMDFYQFIREYENKGVKITGRSE